MLTVGELIEILKTQYNPDARVLVSQDREETLFPLVGVGSFVHYSKATIRNGLVMATGNELEKMALLVPGELSLLALSPAKNESGPIEGE
jgi:hypothetical protein